jgi:hypothetical protein
MPMRLQEAIEYARDNANAPTGLIIGATITMHDDRGTVLWGSAAPIFLSDVPLRNWGPARIGFTSSWLRPREPAPGFSTRGQPDAARLNFTSTPPPAIPIDFSVRREPGVVEFDVPRLGPRIQMEVETLAGNTASGGVTLEAAEDGALLRAIGPSIHNPASIGSCTVTIDVAVVIP